MGVSWTVLKARLRGLVGSILSPLRKGGGAAAPDTRDLKIVCVGDSLTVGYGTSHTYPDLLEQQLIAGGKTTTVVNAGHSGENSIQLKARVAAEVDTEYDPTKACVLVYYCINDLPWSELAAADAIQRNKDFIDEVADVGWYVIMVTPTPAQIAGSSPTYEARRQTYLGLVDADPTLGGRVDAVVRLGSDARLSDCTHPYWFNADLLHYTDLTNGVLASSVISAIRTILPAVTASVAHVPYPCPVVVSSYGLKDAGGAQPSDGENIATWVPLVCVDGSTLVQAVDANRPSYAASSDSVELAVDERMASDITTQTSTRYTLAGRVKLTTQGNFMLHSGTATTDVRFYTSEGPGTHSLYAYDGTNGSLKTMPAGTLSDDAWHTFVAVCDATDASHKLYVDGSLVSTSTYLTWNTDPNARGVGVLSLFGTGGGNGVAGLVKAVVKSPVPVNASERAALEAALSAL